MDLIAEIVFLQVDGFDLLTRPQRPFAAKTSALPLPPSYNGDIALNRSTIFGSVSDGIAPPLCQSDVDVVQCTWRV